MALPRWPKQFYVFCLIPLVHAYTVFETNCSSPVTQSSYVSSPNTRGTLDILWSSLFTIFACTWTLQHPNIPKQRNEDSLGRQGQIDTEQQSQTDTEQQSQTDVEQLNQTGTKKQSQTDTEHQSQTDAERQGQVGLGQKGWVNWILAQWREAKRRNAKRGLESFYRSTLRMLTTIFAPELIIAAAYDDYAAASETLKAMKEYFEDNRGDEVPWSLRHSYYANMGGFIIQLRGQQIGELPAPLGPLLPEYLGFKELTSYHNPYHLNGNNILALKREGHISKLPHIKEAEIKDKSKSDVLVKLIALGQIVWSIVQIIVRAVRRLPVSPLEVAVAAYAICAVIIYAVYWKKPQRVGVGYTIQLSTHETEPALQGGDIIPYAVLHKLRFENKRRFFGAMIKSRSAPMGAPISLDTINYRREDKDYKLILLIAALFAVPFGGIHAAAWNFAFPSTVELMLWRWLTIYLTAAPFCAWLLLWLDDILGLSFVSFTQSPGPLTHSQYKRDRRKRFSVMGIVYLFTFLYIIARLFILVEMFRTLCFLPPGSYVSTWTSNMPHLA